MNITLKLKKKNFRFKNRRKVMQISNSVFLAEKFTYAELSSSPKKKRQSKEKIPKNKKRPSCFFSELKENYWKKKNVHISFFMRRERFQRTKHIFMKKQTSIGMLWYFVFCRKKLNKTSEEWKKKLHRSAYDERHLRCQTPTCSKTPE